MVHLPFRHILEKILRAESWVLRNGLKRNPVQFVCNGAKMQSLMFFSLMGAKCWAIGRTPSLCSFDPLDHLHCGRVRILAR